MPTPIVFFDIAGPDANALREFYAKAFDWPTDGGGNFNVSTHSPLEGTIRQDPTEKLLYLGVPDVAAALEKVAAHGGRIDVPRFEVPGQVVLGLFFDPAGNRMGLVEMDGDTAKVP